MIDIQNMNAVINTLEIAIKPLAEKIGQTGAYLLQVYIKQAFLMGVSNLINITISLLLLIVLGIGIKKCIKKFTEGGLEESECYFYIPAVIIGSILCLALTINSFSRIDDCVTNLFNPQYTAIHNIISDVTGRK